MKQNDEEVIVLRTCNADMTSYNGFKWPESGQVKCDDWDSKPECGNGLHGICDISDDWSLLNWDVEAKALLVRVPKSTIVRIGAKIKFPSGIVQSICSLAEAITSIFCKKEVIDKEVSEISKDAD